MARKHLQPRSSSVPGPVTAACRARKRRSGRSGFNRGNYSVPRLTTEFPPLQSVSIVVSQPSFPRSGVGMHPGRLLRPICLRGKEPGNAPASPPVLDAGASGEFRSHAGAWERWLISRTEKQQLPLTAPAGARSLKRCYQLAGDASFRIAPSSSAVI